MTVAVVLGILLLLVVGFLLYRIVKVKRQSRRLNQAKFQRVSSLYDKLESGAPLTVEDVMPFAQNVATRQQVFQLLADYNMLHLFPPQYDSIVSGAESNLAEWLEFPTELDAIPDEMQYVQRVTIDFDGNNNLVHYEVFRFRTAAPHWAAETGWIIGVVGPYFDDSKPYDHPSSTFCRIQPESKTSPEEEVRWVHQNISLR
jgi:hypothetical protein